MHPVPRRLDHDPPPIPLFIAKLVQLPRELHVFDRQSRLCRLGRIGCFGIDAGVRRLHLEHLLLKIVNLCPTTRGFRLEETFCAAKYFGGPTLCPGNVIVPNGPKDFRRMYGVTDCEAN